MTRQALLRLDTLFTAIHGPAKPLFSAPVAGDRNFVCMMRCDEPGSGCHFNGCTV